MLGGAIAGLLLLAAGAQVGAARGDAARQEVLAVVQQLIDSWKEADVRKAEQALHPEFRLVTLRESPAETQVSTRDRLIDVARNAKPGSWDDRLRDVEVRVDDSGVATVWAKYDFYIDGSRTHCGVVSLQLYRLPEGWKIVNFADTHSPRHCG